MESVVERVLYLDIAAIGVVHAGALHKHEMRSATEKNYFSNFYSFSVTILLIFLKWLPILLFYAGDSNKLWLILIFSISVKTEIKEHVL